MALTCAAAIGACGGDDEGANCGAGTVEVNGQCVVPTTNTADTTSSPTDSSNPTNTTGGTDATSSTNPTTVTDTSQEVVSTECTPDEADKLPLGAPCSRDCECQQNVNGKPLECYDGPYLKGFHFCTRTVDNTLSEADHAESLTWVSGCLDANEQPPLTPSTRKIYVRGCVDVSECKALSAAYTHCGTYDDEAFPWNVQNNATECPCWNTSSGGYMSGCYMMPKSCLIETLPPFNGEYVDDKKDPND